MPYGHRRGEDPRRYPVHAAVYDGDARKLATTLLAKHARGGTALADALAEQDADGGGEGLGLQTPLQRAVRSKKPGAAYEGVRRLIAAGADARAAGGHGSTALHIYAFKGAHDDAKLAQLLVAAGCDPRAADRHGHTAAWVADECGHPRIAEALRQAEAAGGAPAEFREEVRKLRELGIRMLVQDAILLDVEVPAGTCISIRDPRHPDGRAGEIVGFNWRSFGSNEYLVRFAGDFAAQAVRLGPKGNIPLRDTKKQQPASWELMAEGVPPDPSGGGGVPPEPAPARWTAKLAANQNPAKIYYQNQTSKSTSWELPADVSYTERRRLEAEGQRLLAEHTEKQRKAAMVAAFCAETGQDEATARRFLEMKGWSDLASAVRAWRDSRPRPPRPLPPGPDPIILLGGWTQYHHDPSMLHRTLANSNFRREYDKMEVPARLMSLGFQLGGIL